MRAFIDEHDRISSLFGLLDSGNTERVEIGAQNIRLEIETKFKLGALSSEEYDVLRSCVALLEEELRHFKAVQQIRREARHEGIVANLSRLRA